MNSLIRMSEVFGITVDALLKGDVEEIKEMIKKEDQNEFNRLSWVFSVLMLFMILTPVPLAKLLGFWGLGIWALLAIGFGVLALLVSMMLLLLLK